MSQKLVEFCWGEIISETIAYLYARL